MGIVRIKSSRGQMLIEAIVALGILTVAIFAIFSLLTRSTSLNRVISQQYVATYLAAEGIELVKNITDSNRFLCGVPWNQGAADGTYEVSYADSRLSRSGSNPQKLKVDSRTGFYQYNTGAETSFKRTVTIKSLDSDADGDLDEEMRVTSRVTWRGRGGVENEVELEDHFFKWRPAPSGC